MTSSLDELIREMNDHPKPVRIQLAFEVLPGLSDGLLHAVDPDPDSYSFAEFLADEQYSVSLCGTTLQVKDGLVRDSELCLVCKIVAGERQAEFDAEVAR